jgi:hypoxanthine phosphoribosyltransferase
VLRVLIPEAQILARVREMGAEIDRDYANGNLHLICISEGRVLLSWPTWRALWASGRLRGFHGHFQLRQRARRVPAKFKVTKDLDFSVEGADLLIVEDIVDSGVTLHYLIHVLEQRKPRSDAHRQPCWTSPSAGSGPSKVAYVGFRIPDEFVVGYGLDYAERYRNLRDICILDND